MIIRYFLNIMLRKKTRIL